MIFQIKYASSDDKANTYIKITTQIVLKLCSVIECIKSCIIMITFYNTLMSTLGDAKTLVLHDQQLV